MWTHAEFVRNVIYNEETAVAYLREKNLLDDPEVVAINCDKCGSVMKNKRRKVKGSFVPVMRCPVKGCQTFKSARTGNSFFHYSDLNNKTNCKLSLCQILDIVYFFVCETPIKYAEVITGRSHSTLVDWYNMCREVCTKIVQQKGQMVGTTTEPIQIDEARFAGRRKYNRGRLLQGNLGPESTDSEAEIENNRNHGNRIDGPWVFGLKKGLDCRYFFVDRRDRNTLLPIIIRECAQGSVIHSDEWPAYGTLNSHGFLHSTVNHQRHYVDPNTGTHTQSIERSWLDAKIKILLTMRGTAIHMLQSHLDEYCYRMMRKESVDLYSDFLNDIREVYR
ncbi:uncharacterized protein [Palaemon carinicauda]|uniref:uncharacterized protein n=1 Tax=Palaemon carinicauda TaxID=392227 RepID=UPI0035B66184